MYQKFFKCRLFQEHLNGFCTRVSHFNGSSSLSLRKLQVVTVTSRFYSNEIVLSDDENRRRNRLLYRSKQRGFLELDLVLGKWVEDNIKFMDANGISSLVQVLDLENPDLWKWLSGQEEPPESVGANPVRVNKNVGSSSLTISS